MKQHRYIDKFWFVLFPLIIVCNLFVFRLAFVHGNSMEPTLMENECVVIWQLAYTPTAGDIIVTDKNNAYSQNLIKRIIATEGQRVCMSGSQVYVDGIKIEEPYLPPNASFEYRPLDVIVPEDQVFLLGDNRNFSRDSREIGCLPVASLRGKILILR